MRSGKHSDDDNNEDEQQSLQSKNLILKLFRSRQPIPVQLMFREDPQNLNLRCRSMLRK